jgi:hypothetical protein
MPGVPRELIEHALNMDPKAKPVKQPLRRFDEPKRKAIVYYPRVRGYKIEATDVCIAFHT